MSSRDATGTLAGQHAYGVGVAEAATRREGVGTVELGRVVRRIQGRGHAALRVPGGRPPELAFGEHRDRQARVPGVDRRRKSGNTAAEHEEITGRFGHGEVRLDGATPRYGAISRTECIVGWLFSSTWTTTGS